MARIRKLKPLKNQRKNHQKVMNNYLNATEQSSKEEPIQIRERHAGVTKLKQQIQEVKEITKQLPDSTNLAIELKT